MFTMNENQVAALDHTVQLASVWLKRLGDEHNLDEKHHSYSALRAVLHATRDRLPPEAAVHFGAQLPILRRGIYYEGWRISECPHNEPQVDEFRARVAAELPPMFPRGTLSVTKGVIDLCGRKLIRARPQRSSSPCLWRFAV